MSRAEFKKDVKRVALKRAQNRCEAIGDWYGLPHGVRCTMPLSHGVNFDHVILEANSHDNSLENCAAVCVPCHKFKTTKRDIPLAAKTLRQFDKSHGVSKPKRPWSNFRKKMTGEVVPR